MITPHVVLYTVTTACTLTAAHLELRSMRQMKDALDWRNPDVITRGLLQDSVRNVVREYQNLHPTDSLPRKYWLFAKIKIVFAVLLVVEVFLLQH